MQWTLNSPVRFSFSWLEQKLNKDWFAQKKNICTKLSKNMWRWLVLTLSYGQGCESHNNFWTRTKIMCRCYNYNYWNCRNAAPYIQPYKCLTHSTPFTRTYRGSKRSENHEQLWFEKCVKLNYWKFEQSNFTIVWRKWFLIFFWNYHLNISWIVAMETWY